MAINRGPWNLLQDDDGSNLVGSVWNKAAIKTVLLDPIDAETAWTVVPFAAGNFLTAAGGSWYVPTAVQKYSLKGKAATVSVEIPTSQVYAATYFLGVGGWPFTFQAPAYSSMWRPCITAYVPAGGIGLSLVTVASAGNYLDVRRINFSDWPVTGADHLIHFAGTFEIT